LIGAVQVPFTKEGKLAEGGIAEHTEQCIKNLGNVLAAAGTSWEKVVKVNIYLKNMDDYAAMNKVYERVNSCDSRTCRKRAHTTLTATSESEASEDLHSGG
jgi:enamine deaminase RidA (YjgF/YER057c/UK114 family)